MTVTLGNPDHKSLESKKTHPKGTNIPGIREGDLEWNFVQRRLPDTIPSDDPDNFPLLHVK